MSPTPAQLENLERHVRYEAQMFVEATTRMPGLAKGSWERNGAIECFVLHMRNLLHFFYAPEPAKRNPNWDDVYACDYLDKTRAEEWQEKHDSSELGENGTPPLREWNRDSHKWVAHLSITRVDRDHVTWDRKAIYNVIRDLRLDFESKTSADVGFEFAEFPKEDKSELERTDSSMSGAEYQRCSAMATKAVDPSWPPKMETDAYFLATTRKKPGEQ